MVFIAETMILLHKSHSKEVYYHAATPLHLSENLVTCIAVVAFQIKKLHKEKCDRHVLNVSAFQPFWFVTSYKKQCVLGAPFHVSDVQTWTKLLVP